MEFVTSKRHWGNFYLTVILGTLFFLAIGVFVISIHDEALSPTKEILMYVMGAAVILFAFYTPVRYYKNAPNIEVNKESISINGEKHYWSEIETIELTGKQRFKFLMPYIMEGAVFKFKDGTTKYLFDSMYSNAWRIKDFIQQILIEKKRYVIENKIDIGSSAADFETFDYFKGSPFFSFRGLMIWGFILFVLILPFRYSNRDPNGLIGIIVFCFFWFLMNSIFMDYFGVSGHYLIVRNHHFFWKKKMYQLNDIREVTFETAGKMPNCLRVITMDYKTSLFKAGTLNNQKWRDLKQALEERKIKVRNEIYI
jgi:hypothetical protein